MNLVEKIARMIDAEGAFGEYYDNTGLDSGPMPPTARQEYFRAHYRNKAVQILMVLASISADRIKADLIEFEKEGWRQLKFPIDNPEIKPIADKIIADKYEFKT